MAAATRPLISHTLSIEKIREALYSSESDEGDSFENYHMTILFPRLVSWDYFPWIEGTEKKDGGSRQEKQIKQF